MAQRIYEETPNYIGEHYSNKTEYDRDYNCAIAHNVKRLNIQKLETLRRLGVKFNEIGFLIEKKSGQRCLWGLPLSSNNIELSIATLSLMMPERDWNSLTENDNRDFWFDAVERFHEDFYEVIPQEGGIIPISEITSWVNSLRILILEGHRELGSHIYL